MNVVTIVAVSARSSGMITAIVTDWTFSMAAISVLLVDFKWSSYELYTMFA